MTTVKKLLTEIFWFLVSNSHHYRDGIRSVTRKVGLERVLLANSLVRRLLLTGDEPRYRVIYATQPTIIDPDADFELHVLTCERDMLRGVWAIKSFYRYSGLKPALVIHDDGSLTPQSRRTLLNHFPGCRLESGEGVEEAIRPYQTCSYYRQKHVLARKIIDVLLASRSDYIMVMDTDVLWFSDSPQIRECVENSLPFYQTAIRDAYARNTPFLNEHCGLFPAPRVNAGIIGYKPAEFLDLAFLDDALDRIINIPPERVKESIGFPVPDSVKAGNYDPVDSVSWWVLEQTLYALLFGRCNDVQPLNVSDANSGKTHQFVNTTITTNTALVHFVFDSHWNAQFPVGVEHLLKSDFIEVMGSK